jgi:homoprotocatechuate degradation regulator HpaR
MAPSVAISGEARMSGNRPANVKLRSFSRSLPMALLVAREAVMNRFRPSLNLFNLTEQQWRVLRALSSVHEVEVLDLARASCLLAPSLSRILRDLEERGLIVRRHPESDMRRSLISISEKGLVLIDAVAPFSETTYARITETFGKERMEELHALLKELAVALDALPAEDYSGVRLDDEVLDLINVRRRGRPRNDPVE